MVTGWKSERAFLLQAPGVTEKMFFVLVVGMTEVPVPHSVPERRVLRLDCSDGGAYLLSTDVPTEMARLADQAKIDLRFFYTLDDSLMHEEV